ncbi:MAG: flagellar basal body P-ring formation chaperone FlgA [Geminicoccaceae bacterium]
MRHPLIFAWFVALAWPMHAHAAELTLAPGTPLSEAMVGELVRSELAGRGRDGDIAVEVRQPRGQTPNQAAVPMRITLVDLRVDNESGRFQGHIEAVLPTGERSAMMIFGRVDRAVEVLVPANAIGRGRIIAADDLTSVRLLASDLPVDAQILAADLVGRRATRTLLPQRPIRAGDVAEPWLVRRGDEAVTVFRRSSLEIVSAAEALDNGRRGETIRIRNAASGEVRRAVVVAERRVVVGTTTP